LLAVTVSQVFLHFCRSESNLSPIPLVDFNLTTEIWSNCLSDIFRCHKVFQWKAYQFTFWHVDNYCFVPICNNKSKKFIVISRILDLRATHLIELTL